MKLTINGSSRSAVEASEILTPNVTGSKSRRRITFLLVKTCDTTDDLTDDMTVEHQIMHITITALLRRQAI